MRSFFSLLCCCAAFLVLSGCASLPIIGDSSAETDRKVREAGARYKSPSWLERVRAVRDLSLYATDEAETVLIRALSDPHTRVKIEALKGISGFKTSRSFDAVKDIALNESDGNMRWIALKSLSAYKKAEAAPVFYNAMRDSDWIIRETAISGLLDIKNKSVEKESVPYIISALSDTQYNVRIAALTHLRISDPKIYNVLARQIADEKYYQRPAYLKALLSALFLYRFDKQTRKAVLVYITHPNADVRVLALRAIRHSDDKEEEDSY
ncbi:MAG: HEAT repeat domain-containing protein [Spirochaetota bacterium]